jgi:hypothetical protein
MRPTERGGEPNVNTLRPLSHRAFIRWLVAATVAICGLGLVGQARAARVLVLGANGHVTVQNQPLPISVTPRPLVRVHAGRAPPHAAHVSVFSALARLHSRGAISNASYASYTASLRAALDSLKQLGGTRARELGAVINNLRQITGSGKLTTGRLPVLFQTLDRNRQWWSSAPLPSSRQIINFAGSQLDWEYYPGQGIELQPLASFGKADWLLTHGSRNYAQGTGLVSEMLGLGSRRAGGVTWEYYFNFDGGAPPWTSAMSQGTGLQALAHAYQATGDRSYLLTARQALPVFTKAPTQGVAVKTARGIRFVQYTFAPARHDQILNAFLQTLIGLYTYAQAGGNPLAKRLFASGDAEARHELPSFDTGRWSLYQPGVPDTLSYHKLVTGFLHQLCSLTGTPVYCKKAARFDAYLKHPPSWVVP